MKDVEKLKAIFKEYAGMEIRDPQRQSCDCDAVADSLAMKLQAQGYVVGAFQEKGAAGESHVVPRNLVSPEYERGNDGKLRLTGGFKLG